MVSGNYQPKTAFYRFSFNNPNSHGPQLESQHFRLFNSTFFIGDNDCLIHAWNLKTDMLEIIQAPLDCIISKIKVNTLYIKKFHQKKNKVGSLCMDIVSGNRFRRYDH